MCEDKKYNYSKLRGRMVEMFGTIEKTCEAAELRREMVSLALNGKRLFTQPEISVLADVLKIPDAEIGLYFFKK